MGGNSLALMAVDELYRYRFAKNRMSPLFMCYTDLGNSLRLLCGRVEGRVK